MSKKPKLIAIVGPTASGKSDLAVSIAKKFNGEVVSADSRQVYKDLDIGTGKITSKEMKGVPHHLLDVVSYKKKFTVSDFKEKADKAIADILSRGKTPILCGGTGFYVDAVLKNTILPDVPPNEKLRKHYEKWNVEKLYAKLLKLDKRRAKDIDPRNKVRIIRALEIADSLGKVPKVKEKPLYDTLSIGTLWNQEDLDRRISKRLVTRMKQGMLEEAKKLHKKGLSFKRMFELGLEYRYLSLFLQKKVTKEDMLQKLYFEIRHYSQRQMRWFKRDEKIVWISPSEKEKIFEKIEKFVK